MSNQRKVEDYHQAIGHPVREHPTVTDPVESTLRYAIMQEELWEYSQAVGDDDIVEIADALADLLFTVYGTAAVHGIDLDEVFDEVCRSNMTKLDENGEPVPHPTVPGKSGKSHLFEPPRIAEILEKQRYNPRVLT